MNDNGAKYKKKKVENTAYLEKNELIHELITGINYRRPSIPISEVNNCLQETCYWMNESLSQAAKKKKKNKKWNVKRERKKENYHKEHA